MHTVIPNQGGYAFDQDPAQVLKVVQERFDWTSFLFFQRRL